MFSIKFPCMGISETRLLHIVIFLLVVTINLLYVMYMSSSFVEVTPIMAHLALKTNTITKPINNENMTNLSSVALSQYVRTIYEPGHLNVNPNICQDLGKNLKLVVAITSAPHHQPERMAIRQTWGHYGSRKDVTIIFMLGITSDQTIIDQLKQEEYLYGDIITGRFIDTYENLTFKTIFMLEWVDNYCRSADFVLKTDDDMFINVSRLLAFIGNQKLEQRNIYGRLAKQWKPFRNNDSKYYISPEEFEPETFPDFTTGPAYLFPARLAKELYTSALNHTFFKLEDVFLTGMVAGSLKIQRVHDPEFVNERASFSACSVQKRITTHGVTSDEQYDLWNNFLYGVAKCK